MAAGQIQERLSKVPKSAMRIAYFGSVDEALAWLTR
jgi:hypothetical protein